MCAAVARAVPKAQEEVKRGMGATLQGPPNIIIYPSGSQLYESNIGSSEAEKYTLPTVLLKGNRLLLAYNGTHGDLQEDLKEALARAAWEEHFKTGLDDQLKGTLPDGKIPSWFKEGAIRYFAHGWPVRSEDGLRRSFEEHGFADWYQILSLEPRLAGQAFCYFLTDQYYPEAVRQLYNLLKKKGSLPRALRLIAKSPTDSVYQQCFEFYKARFSAPVVVAGKPDETWSFPVPGIVKDVRLSPDGSHAAYATTGFNKRTVWIYDLKEKKRNYITSYQLPPWMDDHTQNPYPFISWQKDGRQLCVALLKQGKIRVGRYGLTGNREEENVLLGVDGIGSMDPLNSSDYLLAAYRKGQSDIVSYSGRKGKYSPYTADVFDDNAPALSRNDLFFASTRPLKRGNDKDSTYLAQGIFRLSNGKIGTVITDSIPYIRRDKPEVLSNGNLLITTTETGQERFATIAPAGGNPSLLTEFRPFQYEERRNRLLFHTQSKDSIVLQAFDADKWIAGNRAAAADTTSPWLLDYRKNAEASRKEDSILNAAKDQEPSFLEGVLVPKGAKERSQKLKDSISRSLEYDPKKVRPYVLQLHSAYFTTKVNNDYFINRYQPYLNYQGQFKFPEVGGMAKGGFTDLFENHHFAIAYRLPAGTDGSDFYVHYENTAKKTDWGLTWFRKVESLKPDPNRMWTDENGRFYPNVANVKTNYYELELHFPLNYYLGIDLNTAIRNDRTVFLATEYYSLVFPDLESTWSISTVTARMNKLQPTLPFLFRGFKAAVSLDLLKGFSQTKAGLYGTGISVEYHQPLYRYITAVGRLQAGYSGGDKKLLYIMGGTDNNITPRVDTTVHFAQDAPYAFQTLITPLRGYYQNRLYGNRYALLNADVYFPLFRTLFPIETSLQSLNLLQLGVFTDIAGAKETWNAAGKSGWLESYGLSARTSLAGYPVRFDIAWPSEGGKPVWYLSLNVK